MEEIAALLRERTEKWMRLEDHESPEALELKIQLSCLTFAVESHNVIRDLKSMVMLLRHGPNRAATTDGANRAATTDSALNTRGIFCPKHSICLENPEHSSCPGNPEHKKCHEILDEEPCIYCDEIDSGLRDDDPWVIERCALRDAADAARKRARKAEAKREVAAIRERQRKQAIDDKRAPPQD